MSFSVDPVVVVSTLHSILEQTDRRLTFSEAVDRLAAVGVVLPGSELKDQVKNLSALISFCDSTFLDARPGRGGGIGLPSVHSSKAKKKSSVADLVSNLSDQDDQESSDDDQLDTGT